MCTRLHCKFQRGWEMGLLEKKKLSLGKVSIWIFSWTTQNEKKKEHWLVSITVMVFITISKTAFHRSCIIWVSFFRCLHSTKKSHSKVFSDYVNEWLNVKCLKHERNKCLTYLSLLASRSDSSKVKMSPSRTGPLTLRMMDRFVSSKNSTRT